MLKRAAITPIDIEVRQYVPADVGVSTFDSGKSHKKGVGRIYMQEHRRHRGAYGLGHRPVAQALCQLWHLSGAELEHRVSYRTTDGKELVRTYWHAIFEVLGHGTHHRGEVSAILDQNDVANDFNGFINYMP